MNTRELKAQCQLDWDNGLSRTEIFNKYAEENISPRKLATIIGLLKDQTLIKKYKALNYVLVALYSLILIVALSTLAPVFTSDDMSGPLLGSILSVALLTLLIGFIRHNHTAYLVYGILVIFKLPSHLEGVEEDPVTTIVGLCFSAALLSLVLFLKYKLYPYMRLFGGPREENDGEYLVQIADENRHE